MKEFINKVTCGDCLKLLKKIPDQSIDLIITDPPYGINYLSNYYKEGNPFNKIEGDQKLDLSYAKELFRVLKDDCACFVFIRYDKRNEFIKAFKDFKLKNELIWVKNNWTAGDLTGNFGNQYETILFLVKGDFKLKSKRYSNILKFDRVSPDKLQHPTEKPVKLIEKLIKCASNTNDLILDPFLGSGTTAVACKILERDFIGFEISQEYCKVANKRLNNVPEKLRKWFS